MKYLLLILAVALLLFLDLRRLEHQIQGVEQRFALQERGEPGLKGRQGGIENGVFGSYSSYWTREHGWRTVFVPNWEALPPAGGRQ